VSTAPLWPAKLSFLQFSLLPIFPSLPRRLEHTCHIHSIQSFARTWPRTAWNYCFVRHPAHAFVDCRLCRRPYPRMAAVRVDMPDASVIADAHARVSLMGLPLTLIALIVSHVITFGVLPTPCRFCG
jgi:hypothetical protein